MKKLVILGGRGIGMIAASVANDLGTYDVIGFLNDFVPIGEKVGKYNGYKVIGKSNDAKKYLDDENVFFFIGYVGMQNEKEIFEKITSLEIPSNRFATLIHPTAIIPKGFCSIGNGVLMAPLTQLSPDTTVEDNCILLPNSFLGHDSTMKRFSHITANSVIGGNVTLGKGAHVGTNATIRENVVIGDFALVGSGSVVLNDVPENSIVVGNPAKILRRK
ncbi:NeuD/PglB/VioB family sugar acetyltransferase [Sunxiuqinia elliptica]|uniref:Acetyltransferase EpsM n=1 Tax=Sunxiuqinia elliptica TaxID=655355 RepID=A0A1I2IVD5_9BACT|nr:NeuD/PglB/VioB family sugar acetyltransferase [Sunxiuqinia elliptica]SFF46442.1 acetyltransferase EpsM [Sunxiuqinia elliptica]